MSFGDRLDEMVSDCKHVWKRVRVGDAYATRYKYKICTKCKLTRKWGW